MDDGDEYDSGYCTEKELADEGLTYEEGEDMEEAWKERTELMAYVSKPHFTII